MNPNTLPSLPAGWVFYKADFSIQAGVNPNQMGYVMLQRSKEEKDRWHEMNEEQRERIDLYVAGRGLTLPLAMADAVQSTSVTQPLEDPA